jgi:hypothetical protein
VNAVHGIANAATGRLIYGINNDNYPAFAADNPKGFQYRFEWFYHAGGPLSGPYSALEPSTRSYIAEKIIPVYGKRA